MPDIIQPPLRILLVDNKAEDAERISQALSEGDQPSIVHHISDPQETLPILSANDEQFDLIVTEHVLPGMTGLELFILLRENDIHKPIVLLTGSGSEHLAAMAMRAGINDYIIKDVNFDYLELLKFTLPLVVTRFKDDLAQRKEEAEKEYRLEFEKLISTLSTNFINLPPERIDEGITEALGSVARLAEAGRSFVYQRKSGDNRAGYELTHSWCVDCPSDKRPPDELKPKSGGDQVFVMRLKKQEIIRIADTTKLDREFNILQSLADAGNNRSLLIMPMTRGEQVFGFVGFDNPMNSDGWSQGASASLQIMAEMFLNAMNRKDIEVKLRESEEQYRHLVENQADGIAMIELQTLKLKFCNASADELFGKPVGGLNGRCLNEFVVPHSLSELDILSSVLKSEEKVLFEIEIFAEQGSQRRVQMSARPIAINGDSKPTEAFCVFRDVTHRHELEEQLRQAQKLEAVGEIASGMAKELHHLFERISRQLVAIKGVAETDETIKACFDNINHITEEGAVLLRQVLSFSGKNVSEPFVVDLRKSVDNLSEMMRRLLGKKYELNLDIADDIWHIYADSSHIEQVIVNITLNARDAMPKGGELVYSLRNIKVDHGNSNELSGIPYGDYVCLVITDTGEGMPEDVRERIFDPYFTTKSRDESSGLGLSVAYNNVRGCGGEIRVFSEVGSGSTFKIYFPRHFSSEESAKLQSKEDDAPKGVESVLLVEDDPNFRQLAEVMLEHVGYTVVVADDGEQAIELFNNAGMHFDLLIADVILPGIDGFKLADTLSESYKDLKVLLISGFPEVVLARDTTAGKPYEFLGKPFSAAVFAERVRKVLDD